MAKRYEQIKGMTRAEQIDYLSRMSNLPCINHGNLKTGPGCLTLSLPAQVTCREDAPCRKGCYCLKGRQCFINVLSAYYRNWRLWNENPVLFEEMVTNLIKYSGLKLVRWHDSGEIPDMEYLKMMVRIARALPDVRFLAYTKKYELVNTYLDVEKKFPDNLTVRFSYWDKDWKVDNRHNLPVAYVDFKDKSKNPEFPTKMFHCRGNAKKEDLEHTCSSCQVCFNKNVKAVVFGQH